MDTSLYLDKIVDLFKNLLPDRLVGIYLHGSLAMGCFHPARSDIDFLVIINDNPEADIYREMTRKVLSLHDEMPNHLGIEFSVLLESALKPFVYPTPFEYHYSTFHRDRYQSDENYRCGGFEDKDLAAHLMVAYHRGVALYGKPLRELVDPVDKQHYVMSIVNDVKDAAQEITDNPVYMTLNLCRVLYYLTEGAVSSKKEGGEWGARVVPDRYKELIRQCLDQYSGASDRLEAEASLLTSFAGYMLTKINQSLETSKS